MVDIPERWDPQAKQQQRVAFADFSIAPWQGLQKNQNAAPTTPPCFSRWLRSSSLHRLIAYGAAHRRLVQALAGLRCKKDTHTGNGSFLVDIPERWDPQAKQQPTGLIAYGAVHRRLVQVLAGLRCKKDTHTGAFFVIWASQDLNPGPSGYENVANFEIPFFL